MSKVSIIVPVYNIEAYLQDCIDSILAQTYTDFELILVDDGSPDHCGDICDSVATKDARIRVLHQKNQGVTRARANGVAAAKGDYIMFVDGDDTIPPHALKTLMIPVHDDMDIVLGKVPGFSCPPAGEVDLQEYRKMCATMSGIHNGPFAKLFRRSLFKEYVFDIPAAVRVGEDAIMNIRLAYRAEKGVYSTAAEIYEYRDNATSATHTIVPSPEADMLMQQCRLASIPAGDIKLLGRNGLYKSLIGHWLHSLHHTPVLPPAVREYRRFLLRIKKESGFKFDLYSYLLFHCPNQMSLTLFTRTWKFMRGLLHVWF